MISSCHCYHVWSSQSIERHSDSFWLILANHTKFSTNIVGQPTWSSNTIVDWSTATCTVPSDIRSWNHNIELTWSYQTKRIKIHWCIDVYLRIISPLRIVSRNGTWMRNFTHFRWHMQHRQRGKTFSMSHELQTHVTSVRLIQQISLRMKCACYARLAHIGHWPEDVLHITSSLMSKFYIVKRTHVKWRQSWHL